MGSGPRGLKEQREEARSIVNLPIMLGQNSFSWPLLTCRIESKQLRNIPLLLSVILRAGAWPSPVVLEMQALGLEMAQQVITHTSLREDLGSVPNTVPVLHSSQLLNPISRDLKPCCTHVHMPSTYVNMYM